MHTILKRVGNWEIGRTAVTKHFKNGKPNLHVEVRYEVCYCLTPRGEPVMGYPNVFHLTNKATALKHLRIVTDSRLDALQRCNAIDALYDRVVGE